MKTYLAERGTKCQRDDVTIFNGDFKIIAATAREAAIKIVENNFFNWDCPPVTYLKVVEIDQNGINVGKICYVEVEAITVPSFYVTGFEEG